MIPAQFGLSRLLCFKQQQIMAERLHKVLAQHGLGSRREIERWMLEGRVRLNNDVAQAGAQFTPGDRVAIDGTDITARLRASGAAQVLLYHKPQHQPVTPPAEGKPADRDDAGELLKESVMERLPAKRGVRWLVINTMQNGDSGLLLLTTDGRLADALRRRAETIPAAYVARVLVPPDFDVTTFPLQVRYDEGNVEFAAIEAAGGEGANRWFRVDAAHSHRRAAVRALFESRGLGVSRIAQVKFGSLELPRDLPRGKHREATGDQLRELYALAEMQVPRSRKEAEPERDKPAAHASTAQGAGSRATKFKAKRVSVDRRTGKSGRRPGGKAPTRARVKPGATGNRKSDR
jgi:23S rRNA pseudouridine2605 synthase